MKTYRLATIVLACSIAASAAGCSDGGFVDRVLAILSKDKAEEKVSLASSGTDKRGKKAVPEGLEFVSDEFEGMDLDINADVVTVVKGSSTDYDRVVELANPEIIAIVDKEKNTYTKITAATAVVRPSEKRMDFTINVRVEGPNEELLETGSLSWFYSQDYLAVNDAFTLEDGSGTLEGKKLKTDTGFRFMEVK